MLALHNKDCCFQTMMDAKQLSCLCYTCSSCSLIHLTGIHLKVFKLFLHSITLLCLFNTAPTGTLTFTRRALRNLPKWNDSTATLTKLHATASGMIENEGSGMLQVRSQMGGLGSVEMLRGMQ